MKDTHTILFEDRGKVNEGWNLLDRTLLILTSVHILHNKVSFKQIQMRGMTSCSVCIFVVYIGKDNQKDANVPARNTNTLPWLWRNYAEDMAPMSHCHFGTVT